MNLASRLLLATSVTFFAGMNRAEATNLDLVTTWAIPFSDSQPFQMAVADRNVFYMTSAYEQHFGRLDTLSGRVTEWPLPYPATSPGDIRVRPGDGAIFFTGSALGELARFDIGTQKLTRWPLPVPFSTFASGPSSLTFDELGRVLYCAMDFQSQRTVIGRIDTTTGATDTWLIPDTIALLSTARVTYVGAGNLFFNVFGYGSGGQSLVRLNTTTGVFTAWAMPTEPAYALTSDASGNIFVQEGPGLARLNPATGAFTEWQTPPQLSEFITWVDGEVFGGGFPPNYLFSIDTGRRGVESVIVPTSTAPVVPTSTTVTSTVTTLAGQSAYASVSYSLVRPRRRGVATGWDVGESVRALATGANGAVFFVEDPAARIGRLTR